ncbi:MAG: NfeD family protein [Parvularculaceae bacterium]|nr:NfeD family protein [Parvularculaceae bacterium]
MEPYTLGALDWRAVASQAGLIVGIALGLWFALSLTQRARATPYQLGDGFGDSHAVVVSWQDGAGYVRIGGELWQAQSKASFAPGDAVKVARKDGFLLRVTRA